MLIIIDYLAIAVMIGLFIGSTIDDYNDYKENKQGYLALQIITEGIIIVLFGTKCYFGAQFMAYSCCPGRTKLSRSRTFRGKSQEYLQGEKFKIKRTKAERRVLNSYFLFSCVTYCFTII